MNKAFLLLGRRKSKKVLSLQEANQRRGIDNRSLSTYHRRLQVERRVETRKKGVEGKLHGEANLKSMKQKEG